KTTPCLCFNNFEIGSGGTFVHPAARNRTTAAMILDPRKNICRDDNTIGRLARMARFRPGGPLPMHSRWCVRDPLARSARVSPSRGGEAAKAAGGRSHAISNWNLVLTALYFVHFLVLSSEGIICCQSFKYSLRDGGACADALRS